MTITRMMLAATTAALLSSTQNASARSLPKPYVGADQGSCTYAPENTMAAFRNGFRLGADDLEGDINITRDGELVMIHDGTLDRTTNCTGKVKDKTLAEIRGCDAAYWWVPGETPGLAGLVADPTRNLNGGRVYPLRGKGVQVPTVREFFAYVVSLGDGLPQATVEIKNIPYDSNFDPLGQTVANALVPLIEEFGLTGKIVVESFWPTSLERVKELNPGIRTLFLTLGSATENYVYVANSAHEYSSSDTLAPDLNQTYVDAVHALGKLVVPWLVDSRQDLAKVVSLGVDGMLTCYVACMLEGLGRPVTGPIVTPEAGTNYDVPACP